MIHHIRFLLFSLLCFLACANSQEEDASSSKLLYIQSELNDTIITRYFYPNDSLEKLERSVNGEKIKEEKYYSNGNIEYIADYENGLPNGTFKQYFDNGELEMEGTYLNGQMNGVFKLYNKDGALITKSIFNKDKREGKEIGWWDTGELFFQGEYDNGEKIGTWIYWDEKGDTIDMKHYSLN